MAQMNRLVRVGGGVGVRTCSVLMGGSGLALSCFVDCRFLRSWSICPLPVWMLLGRSFFTSCVMSPRKDERKPASISARIVDGKGEPNEAW